MHLDPRDDPTVSWMAMDIVGELLRRTGDLPSLARHLVRELRVLTGARCVALIECQHPGHALIDVEPPRQRDAMVGSDFSLIVDQVHRLRDVRIVEAGSGSDPALTEALAAAGFAISLVIPLRVNERQVGAILACGLPSCERMHGMVETFEMLAGVVALTVSDSLLIRNQEATIAERTERLRVSEAEYRLLADNLPDGIARFALNGCLRYVNAGFQRLCGREAAALKGCTIANLGFDVGASQRLQAAVQRVRETWAREELTVTVDTAAGRVELDWRILPEFDEQDRIASLLAVARDVTREREAERHYQQLFTSMLDGFALHEIICDDAGRPVDYRFLAVNPAFEQLTGLQADDLIGRRVLEVLPETEAHWIRTYGKVALTGEPSRFENYAAALGRHFQVMAYQPGPGLFATVFQDVTAAKELEQRQRQAAKMEALGNLAGGIAHDFNNILQAILGYSHLALRDATEGGRQAQAIGAISEAGQRAAELVRQILTFSRQDEQRARPMYIQDVISEVVRMLRSTLPATITIECAVDDTCPAVRADPTAIHQVLLNLATNGLHAMRGETGKLGIVLRQEQARLTVDTEPEACICLRVSDQGCGMSEAVQARIFDPFFTTKAQGEGTGMGLAVVHGIIARYQGRITVESAVGAGTTFHIHLPVCEPDDADGASSSMRRAINLAAHGRVLFVDDEPMVVDLAREFLEDAGFKATCLADALDALNCYLADADAWDLVVSDQSMPGMTGLELARRVKQVRPDLPVLICTGYSDVLNGEPRSQGFDELVHKPYELKDLVARVTRWLARSEI